MFVTSGLLLWLLWNLSFYYLKGAELLSDGENINLSEYKSNVGSIPIDSDYESYGDNDSTSDNDIHISDQEMLNTDNNRSLKYKRDETSFQSKLVNRFLPLVFGSNQTRAQREKLINSKLHEIFKVQHPTIGYNLRNYFVENWPEDVDLMKDHWSKEELDKINEKLPILNFQLRDQYLTICMQFGFDKMKCLTEAELDFSLTNDIVDKLLYLRFKVETEQPNATRLNWKLLDRSSIPDKYNEVPLNFLTIQSPLIYRNREIIDNIHFHAAAITLPNYTESSRPKRITKPTKSLMEMEQPYEKTDSIKKVRVKKSENRNLERYRGYVRDRSKQLKQELQEMFWTQHPHNTYNLKNYQIENWPPEVNALKNYWTKKEMELIQQRMSEFKFVPKQSTYKEETELEYGVVLEKDWTRVKVFLFILDRFRHESGDPDANAVRWDLLDRSQIPSKYDQLEINHFTMCEPRLYKNPEIVHNIHFKRSSKRKAEEIEQDIVVEDNIVLDEDIEIDVDELYKAVFSDNEDVDCAEI